MTMILITSSVFSKIFIRRNALKLIIILHRNNKKSINITAEEDHILNQQITIHEVKLAINKLKLNKSPSLDLIKNSNEDLQTIISRLFNGCLSHGVYPWNLSVTSPLHKKGDKENPDNYRAIILGSCLGKLFSIILLDRLLKFRKKVCPDYPSQLGFCAGSQTKRLAIIC